MNRRHALGVLLAAGALSRTAEAQELSEEAIAGMLRTFTGRGPGAGEAARVRAFLLSVRSSLPPDPEIEPAIAFDPRFPR